LSRDAETNDTEREIVIVNYKTDKGVKMCQSLWPLAKTFDEHSQRTLDHQLEISFFHIELKKFAAKNNLRLYWQQAT
jgi:hypothetical protein